MTKAQKIAYYRRFSQVQQNRERIHTPIIHAALETQYTDFINAYKKGAGMYDALITINTKWITFAIRSLYHDAAKVFGAHVNAQLQAERLRAKRRTPLGFSQRLIDLINAYYEIDILNVCEQITDTTKERIIEILRTATAEQYSISAIVDALQADLGRNRARLIARTETVTAANRGAIIAAKDTGLLFQKEWLATIDSRTRHDHMNVNGQRVEMDGFFIVGGHQMDAPGDLGGKNGLPKVPAKERVNCRCCVLTEPVRDRRGRLIEVEHPKLAFQI